MHEEDELGNVGHHQRRNRWAPALRVIFFGAAIVGCVLLAALLNALGVLGAT
jgi:hypothetical protein